MSNTGVGVFSPEEFDIIISKESLGLNHVVNGFADGTMVAIRPTSERQSTYIGGKGDHSVVRRADKGYSVEITLSQTSHSNDVIFALQAALRGSIDPTFEITILDRSGTTKWHDTSAYMTVEADWEIAADSINGRQWTVVMPYPQGSTGGNGVFSLDDQTSLSNMGVTVPDRLRRK